MPKIITYPNPDTATTIGASIQFSRVALGPNGIQLVYNANNGDTPFESDVGAALSATGRANLAAAFVEIELYMRTQRGYT
jgi:hypothetical protein